jgi:hypothetical protein
MTTSAGVRVALGVLTGLIGLVAMLRLVAGAFTGGMSTFGLVVTLVAMVPWTVYVAWRAWRSRLAPRTTLVVLGLDVLALGLSFAAFVLVWLGDRPVRGRSGEERWVRVEELREPDEADQADEPDRDDRR